MRAQRKKCQFDSPYRHLQGSSNPQSPACAQSQNEPRVEPLSAFQKVARPTSVLTPFRTPRTQSSCRRNPENSCATSSKFR